MRWQCIVLTSLMLASAAGCGGGAAQGGRGFAPPPPKHPPDYPKARNEALDKSLTARAEQVLVEALGSTEPIQRAHAIEGFRLSENRSHAAELIRMLGDPAPIVRFAAALAAGEMKLEEARAPLKRMLQDADRSVQVAARFAQHRLGDFSHSHDLEAYAQDDDPVEGPRVRGNTALVLGLLGEPSALKILKKLRRDPAPTVRQQASEAGWRLGDREARNEVIALISSRYVDDEMLGLLAVAAPRNREVLGHVQAAMTTDYPEVNLVAARAAGMLYSDWGYGIATQGAKSDNPTQRYLAALAFGAIGRSDSQGMLAKLVGDTEPEVRVAAATAILQLNSPRPWAAQPG